MQKSNDIPLTGPAAIYAALERVNIDREEEEARKAIASGAKAKRKAAVKKLHVIQGLKRNELSPKDLTISKIPVVPPVFRPFSLVGETFMPGDANELYRDLLRAKQTYNEVKEELGDEGAADAAYQLYNAAKAVYGFGDPVNPKSFQRGVSGFMAHLTGKKGGPKFCYDEETEILTEKGWTKFKSLGKNLKVLTINPRTLKREWQLPTSYFESEYTGEMHSFEGGAVSLLVTPDHRMWVSKVSTKNNFGIVRANDMPRYVRYRWQIDEDTFTSAEVKHTKVEYEGNIYCVSVPNKLVMVRRNGKVVISGNSVFQRRLFSKTMDSVGRGVITAGADLDMDEIGIPEDMAWKIYGPYIQRRLVQSGMNSMGALDHLAKRTEFAQKALQKEISERPVVYSRAPAWHKYNVVAGWPKLHSGKNIQMNTFTTAGQGADFDGNCIKIGTKLLISVTTENGEIIKSIPIEDFPKLDTYRLDKNQSKVYDVPEGIKVLTAAPDGLGVRWSAVTTFTVDGVKKVQKLTTSSGKFVELSDNESVAVFSPSKGVDRVTPEQSTKHLIPVLRGLPEPDSSNEFSTLFGWLIGAFVSDGWVTNNTIGYTKVNNKLRERFVEAITEYCGHPVDFNLYSDTHTKETNNGVGGQSTKLHVNTVNQSEQLAALKNVLRSCYEEKSEETEGRACLRKRLPPDFVTYPLQTRMEILSGLLDGDGSVSISHAKAKPQVMCAISTSSFYLRDDIMLLLLSLGIRSSYSSVHPKTGRLQKNVNYVVTISTADLAKVVHLLNCVSDYKGLKILESHGVRKDDRDIVPVADEILTLCSKASNMETDFKVSSILSKLTASRKAGVGYTSVTRTLAHKMINEYKGDKNTSAWKRFIDTVNDTTLGWETVKKIEDTGDHEVFDIGVPETKVFALQNGLIVYDTINIHVPSLPESVKEAKERLFPSKMVLSIKEEDKAVPTLKHEQILGLYAANHRPTQNKHVFASEDEALQAAKSGQIRLSDEIEIAPPMGAYPKMARDSSYTPVVELLKRAKESSDKGMYFHKHMILNDLTHNYPDEFDVDSDDGKIVGLTHRPSGFRIHTKKATLPANFLSRYQPTKSNTGA
jgi:intein/homing endonuclease